MPGIARGVGHDESGAAVSAAAGELRWTVTLELAGGLIVLASDLAQLWGALSLNGPVAAIPIFAFEIWFAFTLLIRGLPRPALG
ncbi:hypothetical protein O6R08_02685 [Cutibacterium equinum]|uniref:Uncharacterized protein n=1 Tax=Cutibacterium equinum TaxID=3016342 RepID=A0ABY7R1F9_9ACTN|nr:hypothetical protein [Cutibacterium equinum]WCC80448.1 hypothetical protein O6R08_02685 [Cutibacterium equinum]